jgi:hypothetical protein
LEITYTAAQTVAANQDVLFNSTPVEGGCSINHREGSGLVNLRGMTSGQARARYKVAFGANVAIPTTGTAGPISVAIAIDGEAVPSSIMISTPGAVNLYNNISGVIYIDVPKGCCAQVTIKNIGTATISVTNANLIAERVA